RQPFLPRPLPDEEGAGAPVEVRDLDRFFRGPAEFFLRERLGLALATPEEAPADREPFTLSGLDRFRLVEDLVAWILRGEAPLDYLPVAREKGLLPPGAAGEQAFRRAMGAAWHLAGRVREAAGGAGPETLEVDLETPAGRIRGAVDGVWPSGPLR
ncbi:hypothetical protein G3N55_12690, partial [Dissulfurirhabdus thermomarina]|nr:hypothetical protein [Dissulfurirhabdus thermomarina]